MRARGDELGSERRRIGRQQRTHGGARRYSFDLFKFGPDPDQSREAANADFFRGSLARLKLSLPRPSSRRPGEAGCRLEASKGVESLSAGGK
jgi:hypothetical protein